MDGILTHTQIDDLLARGAVCAERPFDPVQRQPTTLDLRLGTEALAIRSGFLPTGGTVEDEVADLVEERLPLEQGGVLRRGRVYLVRLLESLALPDALRARANPRSSTGRIDVFTRTVVDRHDRFDDIPEGYHGPVWLEVVPRSFDIRVRTGLRLNQTRFVRGDPRLRDDELARRVAVTTWSSGRWSAASGAGPVWWMRPPCCSDCHSGPSGTATRSDGARGRTPRCSTWTASGPTTPSSISALCIPTPTAT